MNRNVSILIIILIILLIAGYLLLLRSRIQTVDSNITPTPVVETITETPTPTIEAIISSPSATPSGKLTPTVKPKITSTGSGSTVR